MLQECNRITFKRSILWYGFATLLNLVLPKDSRLQLNLIQEHFYCQIEKVTEISQTPLFPKAL